MEKILFIAPHLSTGGLPQYLVKKIELLKGEFEIYLIEYSDSTGGRLVIQKNKMLIVSILLLKLRMIHRLIPIIKYFSPTSSCLCQIGKFNSIKT